MADRKDSLDAHEDTKPEERTKLNRQDRGLGPFSGRQLTIIICVTIVAAVAGLPMVASAVIPNAKGVYNACMNNKSGAVRLIDPSKKQKCNKTTEKRMSWNKSGPTGPAGTPGSARAYALVDSDGSVVAARSKNIAVTSPSTGDYCVDLQGGIDPSTAAPVVVSVDDDPSAGTTLPRVLIHPDIVNVGCPSGYRDIRVIQLAFPSGALANQEFTLMVP
jgi:hypothetical protein